MKKGTPKFLLKISTRNFRVDIFETKLHAQVAPLASTLLPLSEGNLSFRAHFGFSANLRRQLNIAALLSTASELPTEETLELLQSLTQNWYTIFILRALPHLSLIRRCPWQTYVSKSGAKYCAPEPTPKPAGCRQAAFSVFQMSPPSLTAQLVVEGGQADTKGLHDAHRKPDIHREDLFASPPEL